jgi:hypothetical protein
MTPSASSEGLLRQAPVNFPLPNYQIISSPNYFSFFEEAIPHNTIRNDGVGEVTWLTCSLQADRNAIV